jgi:glutamate carboxypeptidase
MKAGIAVAIAVLERLARAANSPAVSLLLTPDEEIGTEASRTLLAEVAERCAQVLVLEPSLDGAAKVARKGTGTFDVRFRGRAAHAGLDPEKGASALLELARFTVFAAGLTRSETGTTVTPTVAQSGTKTNVVPEAGQVFVDCRSWTQDEAERVTAAIRDYRPHDDRVTLDVRGGFDRPPLEPTPAAHALYERAKAIAADLGFALGAARVGGGSDGNLTAAAGRPTLDGLGPVGDGAHARHEWVLVDDLVRRAELVYRLVGGRT